MKTVRRNTFLDRLCAAWSSFWRTLRGRTFETINIGVKVKRCDECEYKQGLNAKTMVVDLAMDGDTDDVRHLRELLKAKDEGRLVVLPCRVGDTVYVVGESKVVECNIDEAFLDDMTGLSFLVAFACDTDCEGCPFNSWAQEYSGEWSCDGEYGNGLIKGADFGKTVFLTREEAEAALKGGGE